MKKGSRGQKIKEFLIIINDSEGKKKKEEDGLGRIFQHTEVLAEVRCYLL